jgi:hypothetical protein
MKTQCIAAHFTPVYQNKLGRNSADKQIFFYTIRKEHELLKYVSLLLLKNTIFFGKNNNNKWTTRPDPSSKSVWGHHHILSSFFAAEQFPEPML